MGGIPSTANISSGTPSIATVIIEDNEGTTLYVLKCPNVHRDTHKPLYGGELMLGVNTWLTISVVL